MSTPSEDRYWSQQCSCGDGKTNLECVKEAADNTRTPLIHAMRVFRPTEAGKTTTRTDTKWSKGEWAPHV